MTVPLPASVQQRHLTVGDVSINTLTAGSGPPVLLMHGYPQTHVIWHHVAPMLADGYTVVLTDLRGYGDSAKPASSDDHATYSKRTMARDQHEVMCALGFDRYAVVGHDRGGRVGHRLALDHPDAVSALAVLDIVPTLHTFRNADAHFGLGYFHWFFLAAGNGIPERLIGGDPEFWIRARMSIRHHGGTPFDEAAMREYVRCFSSPEAIHASCEDYRAAASIDLEHDAADRDAGRKIGCPTLALWGSEGFVGRTYDVLGIWNDYADSVDGEALPCDHYLPEEAPEATAERLRDFLGRHGR